jgi:hypothetical protein
MVWACDEARGNKEILILVKAIRVVMEINVEGKRRRGKPIKRRLNTIENDMRAVDVCVGDVKNQDEWRFRTRVSDPK